MKPISLSIACIAFEIISLNSFCEEITKTEASPYLVSRSSKDKRKLLEVFEAVRWQDAGFDLQKIRRKDKWEATIISNQGGRFHLAKVFFGEIIIELPKSMGELQKGEKVIGEGWIESKKNFEMVKSDGKKLEMFTWRHIDAVREDKDFLMSKDEFLSTLKAGKKYEVVIALEDRCQKCLGLGRIFDPDGSRIFRAKLDCPKCSATGRVMEEELLKVSWN